MDVYKLAEELSDMVWHDFDRWNKKVQNTMGYQIIRSSDSIAANIAQGYGRYTPADRKSSIYIQEVHLKKPNHGCENSQNEALFGKLRINSHTDATLFFRQVHQWKESVWMEFRVI